MNFFFFHIQIPPPGELLLLLLNPRLVDGRDLLYRGVTARATSLKSP